MYFLKYWWDGEKFFQVIYKIPGLTFSTRGVSGTVLKCTSTANPSVATHKQDAFILLTQTRLHQVAISTDQIGIIAIFVDARLPLNPFRRTNTTRTSICICISYAPPFPGRSPRLVPSVLHCQSFGMDLLVRRLFLIDIILFCTL